MNDIIEIASSLIKYICECVLKRREDKYLETVSTRNDPVTANLPLPAIDTRKHPVIRSAKPSASSPPIGIG
jgi:hypothetical protein